MNVGYFTHVCRVCIIQVGYRLSAPERASALLTYCKMKTLPLQRPQCLLKEHTLHRQRPNCCRLSLSCDSIGLTPINGCTSGRTTQLLPIVAALTFEACCYQ